MEFSVSALRDWWKKSSKQQRTLAALFLIGILATGMLLIFTGTPDNRSADTGGLLPAATAESGALTPDGGDLFANRPASNTESTLYYAGVVIKTLAVLMLLVGGAVVLRRWQTRRGALLGKQMSLMESVRLSPKQALHLVKVGDRCVLIGATDQSINLLSEIDLESAPLSASLVPAEHPSFGDLLENAAKGGQA